MHYLPISKRPIYSSSDTAQIFLEEFMKFMGLDPNYSYPTGIFGNYDNITDKIYHETIFSKFSFHRFFINQT